MLCCKEESVLSPCWIHFLNLLFVAFVIIHTDLPQGTLPLYLNIKPKFNIQDPVHLWMATGRKKLTHSFARLAIPGNIGKINALFTLFPRLPPSLFHKETGIQTPIRGLFRDINLPPSRYPLSQHLSDIPACCAASRASLDSVTVEYSRLGGKSC